MLAKPIILPVAAGFIIQVTRNENHPSRQPLHLSTSGDNVARRQRQRRLDFWGVDMPSKSSESQLSQPRFPSTFEEVADQAFNAIVGTIFGLQHLDPNVASNAMTSSILDYRPTQSPYASIKRWSNEEHTISTKRRSEEPARMGIEVDGASFLLTKKHIQSDVKGTAEGRAIIIFSLELAKRLVESPWSGFEDIGLDDERSVAIYYNSMGTALIASRELSRLKQESEADSVAFDHIHICWLGQECLPAHMEKKRGKKTPTKIKGLVLIVKPTDYDIDLPISNTGQPTVYADCTEKLQKILFQASASYLPTIVISPRLTELAPFVQPPTTHTYKTGPWGYEQSNYQRSATYGGIEPPVGPTSWLLRDLMPPVYVWIGCSLDIAGASTLRKRKLAKPSLRALAASYRNQHEDQKVKGDSSGFDESSEYSFYSRLAMTQSSMEIGHSWDIFAVEEHASNNDWSSSHQYIGSSMPSRGRPSSGIQRDIFAEWCDIQSD